jgi:hypothetical protein
MIRRMCTLLLAFAAAACFAESAPPAALAAPVQAAGGADLAQRALDRYLEATGGRAAFMAESTSHLTGHLTAFGLTGTVESWTAQPNLSGRVTKLGPFNLLEAFDGTSGWRTDPSGKLQQLDGKDLERERANEWYEHDRFLRPGNDGGTLVWVGSEKDSAGSYDVIDITSPLGHPRRYAFDAATGLLAHVTSKEDQQSIVSTLSDYRSVGARRVPFVLRQVVVGMPANAITVTTDQVEVNVPIDPAHFAAPPSTAKTVRWLKQDGVARLPFEYLGRHVWLRASINGAPPADFLFDTGASITIIDSAYAAKMNLATEGKMEAMGAGSSGGASFAKLQTLRVAGGDGDGVEVADQRVGVLSVNNILAPYFWRDCAGVLGYTFISQFVNEIDYDGRVLTLHDPKSFEYHGAGTKLPITLAGTVPVVKMKLDRTLEGEFRLDVGSNSTVDIHGPFVRDHRLDQGHSKSVTVGGAGFGGQFSNTLVRMKRIDIGPYGWDDPLVSLSGATSGALASEDYAGNIGNQILERFKCTFDYDHKAVYLEPGKRIHDPDRFSRAGVEFSKVEGVIRATQVLDGSPAAKAGIQEGDEIVTIDGRPALGYDINAIEQLLSDSDVGRKIGVEVKRNGKTKKMTMKLRELI